MRPASLSGSRYGWTGSISNEEGRWTGGGGGTSLGRFRGLIMSGNGSPRDMDPLPRELVGLLRLPLLLLELFSEGEASQRLSPLP